MNIEPVPHQELYGEFKPKSMAVDILRIARACHEANRALCASFGDHSQLPWDQAEQWQRDSAIAGVKFRLENPDAGDDCQHSAWMKDKIDNGWKYVFSGYGLLWLLEMALVIVPAFMFAVGVRERRYGMIRLAAGLSVFGVMLNRMDVSLVAYNYNLPTHLKYFPSLGEITLSLFMLVGLVTVYRFVCAKMPVLRDHPDYKPEA